METPTNVTDLRRHFDPKSKKGVGRRAPTRNEATKVKFTSEVPTSALFEKVEIPHSHAKGSLLRREMDLRASLEKMNLKDLKTKATEIGIGSVDLEYTEIEGDSGEGGSGEGGSGEGSSGEVKKAIIELIVTYDPETELDSPPVMSSEPEPEDSGFSLQRTGHIKHRKPDKTTQSGKLRTRPQVSRTQMNELVRHVRQEIGLEASVTDKEVRDALERHGGNIMAAAASVGPKKMAPEGKGYLEPSERRRLNKLDSATPAEIPLYKNEKPSTTAQPKKSNVAKIYGNTNETQTYQQIEDELQQMDSRDEAKYREGANRMVGRLSDEVMRVKFATEDSETQDLMGSIKRKKTKKRKKKSKKSKKSKKGKSKKSKKTKKYKKNK